MELFDNNTETENKNTIQNLSSYELYLNAKGRALYSNGNKIDQILAIAVNGKQFLIDLKACLHIQICLNNCLYDVKKQDVFLHSQQVKITYEVVKFSRYFKMIITN